MNEKQKRFVAEYLIDLNATQAAIRAGYAKTTAYSQGQRLLKHVEVAADIQKSQNKRSERTEITADRVLKEIGGIAFANAGDFFDWGADGVTLRDKGKLTRAQQAVVAEASETRTEHGGTIRLKLHDKIAALDKLCRHLGIYDQGDPERPQDIAGKIRRAMKEMDDSDGPDGEVGET
jgi:phage terminase small subunit